MADTPKCKHNTNTICRRCSPQVPQYLRNVIDIIGSKNIRSIYDLDDNGEEHTVIEFQKPDPSNDTQLQLFTNGGHSG